MNNNAYHYNKKKLKSALAKVGLKEGDVVFSHIGMGFLGYPREGKTMQTMCRVIYAALCEAVGQLGTLLVPTYTYSFCHGEVFDVQRSPSRVGYFTERFRKQKGVVRSIEPIFSVAGRGPFANRLFEDLPTDCFGYDCIYDRLMRLGGSICNIGVGFRYATFVHHAEQMETVPYRFKKVFHGIIKNGSMQKETTVIYYVRKGLYRKATFPDLTRLEQDAKSSGYLKEANVGLGKVTNILCKDLYDLCIKGIRANPWYLARGPRSS